MDLNICLYCEKQLQEENLNFCSVTCQTNEASKPYDTHQLKSYLAQNSPSPAPTCEIPYPRRRSSLYQTSSNHPYSQASSSSFSSASSASSVITLSSSNIQNTLKQQSSWESTSSYYQQQHQQNVYTDHLF